MSVRYQKRVLKYAHMVKVSKNRTWRARTSNIYEKYVSLSTLVLKLWYRQRGWIGTLFNVDSLCRLIMISNIYGNVSIISVIGCTSLSHSKCSQRYFWLISISKNGPFSNFLQLGWIGTGKQNNFQLVNCWQKKIFLSLHGQ